MEPPLLSTKNAIPLIPAEFVRRPRLVEQINRGVRGPLTLLSAPAGFGKTSLLMEWARQSALPIAWLTLSREDNDQIRFARYLTRAFHAVSPRLGEEIVDYVQSGKSGGLELGLTLLVNDIAALPADLALVLDEYHVIETPAIHESLDFFLKHRPRNLHLVIASRSEPALDMAFLRAKGWALELGADDLRFTGDEVAQFLRQTMGLQLPAPTIQALEERTEGWVTGLQLAALSLRHQADPLTLPAGLPGHAHYLVDFLAEEVLSQQPEDVRQFLLRSSILEALSGPLCEAVVEPAAPPGYGTRMLDRLHHANLFVTPLDEQHDWFRYHRLFADFLRYVHSASHAAELPDLHRRAAVWLEAHGHFDEAFQHAVATGDGEWAAELIERSFEALIKDGELLTLAYWLGKLPGAIVRERPHLAMAYAWGLILTYQLDDARLWLEDAEQILNSLQRRPAETAPLDPAEDARIRKLHGGLAICRSTLALFGGDVQQAVELSRAALDYLPEDDPFSHSLVAFDRAVYSVLLGDTSQAIATLREAERAARRANNLLVRVLVVCQLAEMQAMQGQLSQALATLQKAHFITLGAHGNPLPLAGIVDTGLGEILRERDMLREARERLERGRRVAQAWWSLSSLDGVLSLARLLQSQGDVAGSQALITEAADLALSTESSQWDDIFVAALAVRLALQRNDLAAATQWWKKSGLLEAPGAPSRENYPYIVFEYLLLTQARFHFAIGQDTGDERQLQRALELLQSVLPDVERFRRVTAHIEILVLRALTEYELGEIEQAVQALLSALALGEPEDYRRTFLDEGRVMAELLARCQSAQPAPGAYLPSRRYIESLLEACRREAGVWARQTPGPHPEPPLPAPAAEQRIEPAAARAPDDLTVSLSAREVEVLALIAEGQSNQEISAQLCLALNTVKRHAYNIYAKLDVKNRTQAVSRARQFGLIP